MKELKIIAPAPPKPLTPPPIARAAGTGGDRISATPPLPLERPASADGSVPRRTELVRGRDASLDATRARAADRLKQQRKKKAPPGKKLAKTEVTTPKAAKRKIRIEEQISLQTLAARMSLKATDVLMKLISLGQVGVHINSTLDAETAMLLASEFGYEVEDVAVGEEELLDESRREVSGSVDVQGRAPVITVMGHVDHGKTSLLDAIRQSDVASGEAGGITQHIGAYKVQTPRGTLCFLDTPGHEAFTAMRARGAQVTDVVVLVVAADDGVMPQTVEAVNHSKAAKVPIIVAVNKVDKPEAQPDRVKRELGDLGLIPEDWGGETMFIEVSAKTKQGIENLLERIALQAEVMELKADVAVAASGTVIEARLDRGRGPVANILVQRGTLRSGDIMVAGTAFGKIRALLDDRGQSIQNAGPSTPVEVLGLSGVPNAGDRVDVVSDLRKAQAVAESRIKRTAKAAGVADSGVSLEKLHEMMQAGETAELKLVIKADVQGSVEAVSNALSKLSGEKVKVSVIHTGVGGITESDVNLAAASKAVIVGFNVRPAGKASQIAEQEGVEIKLYTIIYEAIDEVRKAMAGLLAPTMVEKKLGRADVLQTFSIPKIGIIAGCRVTEGKVVRTAKVRIVRDSVQVWDGKIGSLRRIKDDVREVLHGFECGISLDGFNDIKQGDVIEAYEIQEVAATL
ncbi:MAG: translation initiation factor IF-2 [Deltaproteobacteria bacterium]|nr:translation initiation factor IF-2 [Deltaproteobacteria bacterium]